MKIRQVKTWHFYDMWKYVESSIRKSSIRKFSALLLSIKKFSRVENGLWSEQIYSKLVFQIFYHYSKEVNKTIFSKFFFWDHFSVVSGGNKRSKNWRKSCCKQIKVTKVTYCEQSQQCPFWTLFDIFAPKSFKFACCLGGLTIGFVKIIIKQNLSKNCTSCLTSQKKSSGNLMNLG